MESTGQKKKKGMHASCRLVYFPAGLLAGAAIWRAHAIPMNIDH
jgi:hypothetical protein